MEESNTNWQFEPPGSGAARVQKEHAIPLLYRRLMGMAAYDSMKAGRPRVQVEVEVAPLLWVAGDDEKGL